VASFAQVGFSVGKGFEWQSLDEPTKRDLARAAKAVRSSTQIGRRRGDDQRLEVHVRGWTGRVGSGFSPDQVSITADRTSSPSKAPKPKRPNASSSTGGISARQFKRQFSLADYVQETGTTFDNTLLKIELMREIREDMKPPRIAINGASSAKTVHQIEAKAA
jgi:hypothetical protein